MKQIEEEDFVDFTKYEQLSYKDNEGDNVELFKDGELLGGIKVWLDSEMDDREYICINYTIVYLDTLAEWKPTPERIAQFRKDWGQEHIEICDCLGFDPDDEDESNEDIINTGNYFWDDEASLWLNKHASGFQGDDQEIADYLRYL